MLRKSIVIIGAGPCGIGAGWRLRELGYDDFVVLESTNRYGGLATSFVDDQGFTWDIGGHVQFSHYEDFDRVMHIALGNDWLHHQRESWVWICNRFVPYPFQNNIGRLPETEQNICLQGLEELVSHSKKAPLNNFRDWIKNSFGHGISDLFMIPYNWKVWAHDPSTISFQWIGERVATVDLERIKENIRLNRDDLSWGPNSTFQFPLRGGTGSIWDSLGQKLSDHIQLSSPVLSLNKEEKTLRTAHGEIQYEHLLSTIPLNRLMGLADLSFEGKFLSSNSHIIGVGLLGSPPEFLKTKCWIYFPDAEIPFYRLTVFSNYSPYNTPDSKKYWSVMCETAGSDYKPVNKATILEETVNALLGLGWIKDQSSIVSRWQYEAAPGYPTPFLGRDELVHECFSRLEKYGIYSRGRFGAWKYEVSNQDHTFMQGFEWADWLVKKAPEVTVFSPSHANASGKRPIR